MIYIKRKVFLISSILLICFIIVASVVKYQEKDSDQHNTIFTYQKQKEIDHIIIQDKLISPNISKKVYQIFRDMELVDSNTNDSPYVIAGGMPISIYYVNSDDPLKICLFSNKVKVDGTFFDITNESNNSEETFIQKIRSIMESSI